MNKCTGGQAGPAFIENHELYPLFDIICHQFRKLLIMKIQIYLCRFSGTGSVSNRTTWSGKNAG
jgi:hypothetical protein